MKKTLIIGSTVTDVIINIPHLPKQSEDINITYQKQQLGGCAYNVSHLLKLSNVPYILCSPVGTGIYGDFVASELHKVGITPFMRLDNIENGCCYCIVDEIGERTFLCKHGAEYIFKKEWMKNINLQEVDSVYFCGLELEEETGEEIVSFIEEHPELTKFFAPGPRINKIPLNLMQRILRAKPIIHLNQKEIYSYTGTNSIEEAAIKLQKLSENIVIVTLGENGTYYMENGKGYNVPAIPTKVTDTIGAGDSHIASIISFLKQGDSLEKAIQKANIVSSAVVSTRGSLLSQEKYNQLSNNFLI